MRSQLLLAVCSEEPPAPSQMLGAGRTAPRGHGGFPQGWGPLLSCSGVGASLPDQRGKVTSRARERAHRPPSGFIAQDSRQTRRVDKGRGGQSPDPRAGEPWPPRQVTCPLWPVTRELDGLPNTHQLPQRPEKQPCSTHSQLFPPAAGRPHQQGDPISKETLSTGRPRSAGDSPHQQGDPAEAGVTPEPHLLGKDEPGRMGRASLLQGGRQSDPRHTQETHAHPAGLERPTAHSPLTPALA